MAAVMIGIPAEVGSWYQTPGGGYLEVVAFDPDEGTLEVQHYDGTIEEYAMEDWEELRPYRAEPPEDWRGSLDLSRDDYEGELDGPVREYQGNPLDLMEEPDLDMG
jgi:Family of unknown function (DUF6763)